MSKIVYIRCWTVNYDKPYGYNPDLPFSEYIPHWEVEWIE